MKPVLAALACAAAAATGPLHAAPYVVDVTHTFVSYEVMHFGTSTSRGRFDKSAATLEFDRSAKSGRVEVTIDIASVNTGVAALDSGLRSDGFLNAAQFPTARFTGDRFRFEGDKLAEVAGSLSLMGKTLPVVLKSLRFNCYLHPFLKRETCGGDFETTIQRSQWGVSKFPPEMIGDDVKLLVQIEAIRQ